MINVFLTVFKLRFHFLDHLVLLNILFPPLSQSQSYPSILCLISNPSSIYCTVCSLPSNSHSFKPRFFQTLLLSRILSHPSMRPLFYSTTLYSATLLFGFSFIRTPFFSTTLLFDHTSIRPPFYSTTLLFDHPSI